MDTLSRLSGANGSARKSRKAAPAARRPHTIKVRRVSALALAGVGVALLVLSLWHCTDSIIRLTGSWGPLAFLLALGIDAGMVVSEWAVIVCHRDADLATTSRWAYAYIVLTVALSMILNCLANMNHAEEGQKLFAAVLGLSVPVLVFILFKVAGSLFQK